MISITRQHAAILLLFLAGAVIPQTARAQSQIPVGEYELDEALSDDINTAINAATSKMNFIARPIARKRLRSSNPVQRVVTIAEVGDSVEITSDRLIMLRAKPDGVPMRWTAFRGEELDVTTLFQGGILSNTFAAGDGARTNRYTLRDDGLLEMHVMVTSPRLQRPVEYKRLYRRIESASR